MVATVLGLSRIDAQGLGLGRASSELQVVSLLETVCGGFGGGERMYTPLWRLGFLLNVHWYVVINIKHSKHRF